MHPIFIGGIALFLLLVGLAIVVGLGSGRPHS